MYSVYQFLHRGFLGYFLSQPTLYMCIDIACVGFNACHDFSFLKALTAEADKMADRNGATVLLGKIILLSSEELYGRLYHRLGKKMKIYR